jgi:hypothetical protein
MGDYTLEFDHGLGLWCLEGGDLEDSIIVGKFKTNEDAIDAAEKIISELK